MGGRRMEHDVVGQARDFAIAAHAGQVDKSGAPYATHPERVAGRLVGDDLAQAVAWLHDVVEDTTVTLDDLSAAGFPLHVVNGVDAMTRRRGEHSDDYYARVAGDPLALRVKRADIADNTDPARVALLDHPTRVRLAAKYEHALRVLDHAKGIGEG